MRKGGTQNYEVVRQNLIAETDMLKKLRHPNLPSIVDVIDMPDTFLIVMDYIEGKPLSEVLAASGAQPQDEVIEWSKQLCDVLGYLHSRNPAIIYRDMKPSNVMLKPDNSIELIDFGTAREYKVSSIEDTTNMGTRGYAAPEQYGGIGQTDARTDIYCLGKTIYHLVTGHNPALPPYEMYPIRQWNPSLSSGLEEIIQKCTRENPNERYQNCAELLYALDNIQYLDEESKKTQKRKWNLFVTSVVLSLVMGLGAVGFKFGASAKLTNTYQSYINNAKTSMTVQDRETNCKKAIDLDPAKVDAYEVLLQTYYKYGNDPFEDADDEFSLQNEYHTFQTITGQFIKSDLPEYNTQEFADRIYLKLGEALYLCSDNKTQGRSSSVYWLGRAAKYCSEANKGKANAMYVTANYYKDLNDSAVSSTGEVHQINYLEYWTNLLEIEKYTMADIDSPSNLLLPIQACELCLSELTGRAASFRAAGVERVQALDLIAKIDSDLNKIQAKFEEHSVSNASLIKKLRDARNLLNSAKDKVNETFVQENN